MGIYGHRFDNVIDNKNEESEVLNEVSFIIKGKKGKTVEIYVRTANQATKGGSIPKGKQEAKPKHDSSVKIKYNDTMVPVQTHSGEVEYDENELKQSEIPSDLAKASINFITKNLEDLNKYWGASTVNDEEVNKILTNIIDRSINDINELRSTPNKQILSYFKDKKKEK